MALTRITQTVIEDSAVSTVKIANSAVSEAKIAPNAVTADKLGANAASNVLDTITDATTDVNMGSKFFFDKSDIALGIGNVVPMANSISVGNPANVIIRYIGDKGGNVIIGDATGTTNYALDIRGSSNVGALTVSTLTVNRALITSGAGLLTHSAVSDTELGYLDGVTSAVQTQFTAAETRRTNNIAGAISTVLTGDLTADKAMITNGSGKIAASAVTATELGYVDGVTSAIQTQFTGAESRRTANIAGAISTVLTGDLTASRAMVSDGSGKIAVDTGVTATELGYLDATSSIQTQLDAKAALAGATFTGEMVMQDDLTVQGNLTVLGTNTVANTQSLVIQDNMIMLANGTTGSSSLDVGLLLNRGNQGNAFVGYDETNVAFVLAETKDPVTNTVISPTSYANLVVGNVVSDTISTGAISATTITLSADGGVQVPNDGNIGSAGATDAMQISSGGIVTFKDDILIKDGGTIGSASAPTAMSIDSGGIVTFIDDIKLKLGGTIGPTSQPYALTFPIGSNVTVHQSIGIAGNTSPFAGSSHPHEVGGVVLGTPANLVMRTANVGDGAANLIIGDATATSPYNLDVRGTANVGAITATGATVSGLTASRALQSDGSKGLESSATTATELGYISGLSSAVQTQLDSKIATTVSASNDFVTYTRVNANLNVVQDNVAAITGGGILLRPFTNSLTAASTANTFFLGKPMPGDGLANVLNVSLDGIVQTKDKPGTANNDFIMNAVASHASIVFTAPSIPVGTKVVTVVFAA